MEKTLIIDGRQVTFKSTGAFLLRYKSQFKRDAMQDILRLQSTFSGDDEKEEEKEKNNKVEVKNIEAVDLEVFFNLAWTLAKTADPSIPPPMEWLDGFGEFPLMDIIPELTDIIFSSISSTVSSKKK